jgi:hypothetical protein
MKRRSPERRVLTLVLSLAATAVLLAIGSHLVPGVTAAALGQKLLLPMGRLLFSIAVGLAMGQMLEATGWTRYLALLAGPLFRFGRLGPRCAASFTAAFFSGVASNAMLLEFLKAGHISRRQLFLTNFVNQAPLFFLHLPTTFFIIVPLTGQAGVIYLLLTLAAALLRTGLVLLYGRLRLPRPLPMQRPEPAAPGLRRQAGHWLGVLRERLPARFMGIARTVVPIYSLVYLLQQGGVFKSLETVLTDSALRALLPVEALSVVALSFMAEFASGFAAAGALQHAGVLSVSQTVIALLLGNIVAFPIRALRHQLPNYLGIFAPAMGTQLMLCGQALRIASLAVVGGIFGCLV